ncbi:MAG: SGNH/GDSL hydrolase family protein [Lautropia sp.]|nr:SGNH/GDSL hydrolase family protein [Lautropia sp.]
MPEGPAAADEEAPRRILFVGNSFVSRNDLPSMVEDLAKSAGHLAESESIVAGGASLRRHLNSGAIARALAHGRWDQVVLQEQSTLPIKNPTRYHENVRAVHALASAAGARTVLYLTWARRAAPDAQQQLTAAVLAIGAEIGAAVAPAGQAWQVVLKDHPGIDLYSADGSHPTAAGSWLAACVLYRTLFRDRELAAAAPGPAGMAPEIAAVLAEVARRVAG